MATVASALPLSHSRFMASRCQQRCLAMHFLCQMRVSRPIGKFLATLFACHMPLPAKGSQAVIFRKEGSNEWRNVCNHAARNRRNFDQSGGNSQEKTVRPSHYRYGHRSRRPRRRSHRLARTGPRRNRYDRDADGVPGLATNNRCRSEAEHVRATKSDSALIAGVFGLKRSRIFP